MLQDGTGMDCLPMRVGLSCAAGGASPRVPGRGICVGGARSAPLPVRPCLSQSAPPFLPRAARASLTRTLMPPCEDAEEGFNVRWFQCAARGLVQGL